MAGEKCHCGFPTPLFTLHDREDEELCLQRCEGEDFESCGNNDFFVVYQTQVQGSIHLLGPKRYAQLSAQAAHMHNIFPVLGQEHTCQATIEAQNIALSVLLQHIQSSQCFKCVMSSN